MKKSTVVIVGDDPNVLSLLNQKLPEIGCDPLIFFSEGKKACKELKDLNPGVVLIDVDFKGDMNGMEAASLVHEVHDVPVVYMAKNPDSPLLEKSKVTAPYGYIFKPFREQETKAVIESAIVRHNREQESRRERDFYLALIQGRQEERYIFIKSDFKIIRIELEDICFVEALKDYIAIHTFNRIYTTHISMKDVLNILPEKDFVRVHRSFIVRINKIFSIKYPQLILEGNMKSIPMGGLYKRDVYERLRII